MIIKITKAIAIIAIVLLSTGCFSNPFVTTNEEKAIALLEKELTTYSLKFSEKQNSKSYLQEQYPDIYKKDNVKIISFGYEPYTNKVYVSFKDGTHTVKLVPPRTLASSKKPSKDDVITFTKNKEKIKEAIRAYFIDRKIQEDAAPNSSGKVWTDIKPPATKAGC